METIAPETLKPTTLSKLIGVSVPYASQLLAGKRTPPQAMAIRIYRATGRKLGPIEGASEEDIAVLERFQGAA